MGLIENLEILSGPTDTILLILILLCRHYMEMISASQMGIRRWRMVFPHFGPVLQTFLRV